MASFSCPRRAKLDRAGHSPRIPRLFVRPGIHDFSAGAAGGLNKAGPPAIRRHPPDPHERNCVELTPSGRHTGRARILTWNRIAYRKKEEMRTSSPPLPASSVRHTRTAGERGLQRLDFEVEIEYACTNVLKGYWGDPRARPGSAPAPCCHLHSHLFREWFLRSFHFRIKSGHDLFLRKRKGLP